MGRDTLNMDWETLHKTTLRSLRNKNKKQSETLAKVMQWMLKGAPDLDFQEVYREVQDTLRQETDGV